MTATQYRPIIGKMPRKSQNRRQFLAKTNIRLMEKPLRHFFFLYCLCFMQACSMTTMQEQQTVISKGGIPYLGIAYSQSDTGKGIKINRILPGPFEQAIHGNSEIDIENDRLVQINDIPVTASNFKEIINTFETGQVVSLMFEKSATNLETLVSLKVVLANELDWTGPIKKLDFKKPADIRYTDLPDITKKNHILNFIDDERNKSRLQNEIQKLDDFFYEWQSNNQGFNTLSRVSFPFKHPDRLMELESHITSPLADLHQDTGKIFYEIAKNLDLNLPDSYVCSNNYSWNELIKQLIKSKQLLQKAFEAIDEKSFKSKNSDLYSFLTELFRLDNSEYTPIKSITALNTSMHIDYNAMLSSSSSLQCLIKKNTSISITKNEKSIAIPYELRNAVKGKIEKISKEDGLWLVYGSIDDNTYDMSVIDIVYDPDGNDTYIHQKPDSINLKLIIDKAGNDYYFSEDIGPASGWLGNSFLIDHKGNDIYRGKFAANGTGMMGIGLLIDYEGEDSYTGHYFSNGAGVYGAGIILDLGDETDAYHSATFSQGFGGPRGLGLIYEYKGNDLYRANSITPSAYGTPGVYMSFSQGVGFGIRQYDSGGIGIIYDAHGSDRYEGGEFSQAGGYYWGLGIIHDNEGHDNYYGNRYSQGFAAHQATGILVDRKGNDNYWGMTAACQGAAWDIAMGFLLDYEGNDTYRGNNLCQGSAAMQARGWLIDLDGVDHYSANSKSSQGHSGNNTYHYNQDNPVYSWSLLLDAGGDNDHYSNDRGNNQVGEYSEINIEEAAESLIHGLFIDYDSVINH